MRTIVCNFWEIIVLISVIMTVIWPLKSLRKTDNTSNTYIWLMIFGILGLSVVVFFFFTSAKVINVVGMEMSDAIQTLQEIDLKVDIQPEKSIASDVIIEQSIMGGEYVVKGTVISLTTSHTESEDTDINFEATDQKAPNSPVETDEDNEQLSNSSFSSDGNITSGTPVSSPQISAQQPQTPSQEDPAVLSPTPPQDAAVPTWPILDHVSDLNDVFPTTPLPEEANTPSLPLISQKYLYVKTPDVDLGTLMYIDSEDVAYTIIDPDTSQFEVLNVTLYIDSDEALGLEASIHFENGAGFGLTNAFYNGMQMEVSAGTYLIEFVGEYVTDGPYIMEEDGSISYFRRVCEVEVTFDHSGNYILHLDWGDI